jgi:TIR domain
MTKPVVFISHIHLEEVTANALEAVLRKALLGALDIFNSSNRRSISVGDPWRDRIKETLRGSTSLLVLCSPESVTSPWVNFESGGAWVSGTRVISCCINGMEPSSLPAPLNHLQALNLASPEGLSLLVKHLAEVARLDVPAEFDYDEAVQLITTTWADTKSDEDNSALCEFHDRASRRPEKFKGKNCQGFFTVYNLKSTVPQQTHQFRGEGLIPGDSITSWLKVEGGSTDYYAFARSEVADLIENLPSHTRLYGTIKCLGQIKVFDNDISPFDDEERGVSYHPAWLVTDARKA